jgi:hypothetical protein
MIKKTTRGTTEMSGSEILKSEEFSKLRGL